MAIRETELSYLRDELNQRMKYLRENSHQTITHIILLWVGVLTFFGTIGKLCLNTPNMIIIIVIIVILFLSNIIILFAIKKDIRSAKHIGKLAAYIIVFYETKIGRGKKGEHIFWEISNIEIKDDNQEGILDREYRIMAIILFALELIYSYHLFLIFCTKCPNELTNIFFCLIVLLLSMFFTGYIFKKDMDFKNMCNTEKMKWVNKYFRYAKENKYYTKAEIEERFSGRPVASLGV